MRPVRLLLARFGVQHFIPQARALCRMIAYKSWYLRCYPVQYVIHWVGRRSGLFVCGEILAIWARRCRCSQGELLLLDAR